MFTPIGNRKQMERQSYSNTILASDVIEKALLKKRAQLGLDKNVPPEEDQPNKSPNLQKDLNNIFKNDEADFQNKSEQPSSNTQPSNTQLPQDNAQERALVISSPGIGKLQTDLAQQILDLLYEHNLVSVGGFSVQKFDTSNGLQLVIIPQQKTGPVVQKA